MSKRQLPALRGGAQTYWVSRDSVNGELAGVCSLWCAKPTRVKHQYRTTWVATDHRKPGHLCACKPAEVLAWFGVTPETDLELIRVEQHPSVAAGTKA